MRPVKTVIVKFGTVEQAHDFCKLNPYFHVQGGLHTTGGMAVYNHAYYGRSALHLAPNLDGYSDAVKATLTQKGYNYFNDGEPEVITK